MDQNLFRAFLAAQDIANELLQAHTRKEYCGDDRYSYHVGRAEVRLKELASYLGSGVENAAPDKAA